MNIPNIKSFFSRFEVALAVIAYSFCSGTLVLINKLILHRLPYPSLVITVQLWAAIAFIYFAKFNNILQVDEIRMKNVIPYLYYTVAFSLGVFCNMKSLSTSNVETIIIFRSCAPIIVSVLDVLFLGREYPSLRSMISLSIIVAGSYGYALNDEKFQSQGYKAYFWPTMYLFVISFEMCYGKKIIRSVDLSTKSGPVLYTNLLGWPPMLLFAYMNNEYGKFWNDYWERIDAGLPPGSIFLLMLGCIVGTGIGYSSWWCRDKVSATSFTLIGVMNKCLTILLNCIIWDQHAPPMGIMCLLLCLLGGSLYKQAPLRNAAGISTTHTSGNNENEKVPFILTKQSDDRGDITRQSAEDNLGSPSKTRSTITINNSRSGNLSDEINLRVV